MSWISRHRGTAAAVAIVGLGAMSLAACGQASDEQQADVIVGERVSPDESAGAVIARASESTTSVESGRMRMSYTMSGSGMGEMFDLTMSGEGSFTDFGALAELTFQTAGGPAAGVGGMPLDMVIHEIVDGTALYMKVDSAQAIPGLGSGWTKLDMSDMPGAASAGGMGGLGSSFTGFLDSLKGAGSSVVESGTDTIDGDPVTVYTGTIDPQAAMEQASPDDAADVQSALDQLGGTFEMPFIAWVDSDGMVRKLEMHVTADMAGTSMDMTMTIELYDLGAPVTIEVPPADQVTDGMAGLGGLLGPELGTA